MRQQKLRLEDILVESFSTSTVNDPLGTVKGRDADTETCEEECGTILTYICRSCRDSDCPPQTCNTCGDVYTCKPEHTCPIEICGGMVTVVC